MSRDTDDVAVASHAWAFVAFHVTTGTAENLECKMDVSLRRASQLSKGISVATGLGERKKKKRKQGVRFDIAH